MVTVGFHASHEQAPPSALLESVVAAERAGFGAGMCSDHLAPWSERQGHSGNPWPWLGAALQATSPAWRMGVVTAPVQRYHPAVAAQAFATLAELFPGRFWAALRSGENLNEHVTGHRWPDKPTRDRRLLEAVDVIRALLRGDEVTHDGLVRVDRAKLWSLPAEQPLLLGAAVSEATARVVGGWADGLITIWQQREQLERVLGAYRDRAGDSGVVAVQVHLSWMPSGEEEALAVAHEQWASNASSGELAWNLETPAQFDAAAKHVRPDDIRDHVLVSGDLKQHVGWLQEVVDLGADELYLHHVGRAEHQQAFIEAFAAEVLPELEGAGR